MRDSKDSKKRVRGEVIPPFPISREDIEDFAFSSDFRKGLDYYKKGRVVDFDIEIEDDDSYVIRSFVRGSGNRVYQQAINVEREGEEISIDGLCECPVEYDCKHVVAVCLEVAERYSKLPPRSDIPWLDRLVELSLEKEERDRDGSGKEEKEYRLHYHLLYSEGSFVEDLRLFRAKKLKKGGYSKGAKVNMYEIIKYPYLSKYSYLSDKDRNIISILAAMIDEKWSATPSLKGELGSLVLELIVETGAAFYDGEKVPLSFSNEPIYPVFEWKRSQDGRYSIVGNLDDYALIYSDPVYAIDRRKATIHRLESSMDVKILEHLLSSPEIEEEHLRSFLKSSFERLPKLPISMPEELMEIRKIDSEPLGVLVVRRDPEGGFGVDLFFDYEGVRIEPHPVLSRNYEHFGAETVLIERKIHSEEKLMERLDRSSLQVDGFSGSRYRVVYNPHSQRGIEEWRRFIEEEIPTLRSEGWVVEMKEDEKWRFEYDVVMEAESFKSDTSDWFELSFNIDFGSGKISLVPLVASLIREFDTPEDLPPYINLPLEEGHFVHLEADKVKPVLQTLYELYDRRKGEERIEVAPYNAHLLCDFDDSNIVWKGSRELSILSRQLRNFDGIEKIEPSKNLKASMRAYQKEGLSWLHFLYRFRFAGVLADDMGLGKTLQTLAFLQKAKESCESEKPSLIIMPTSLLSNWKNEIEKFVPNMRYISLYGPNREALYEKIEDCDIVLTSYQIVQRDIQTLEKMEFFSVILDEAQKIKNPRAKISMAVKRLEARYRLALTGTPMENHLGELWSIFDFLMPGFLGSLSHFKKIYQNRIEKDRDMSVSRQLRRKIAPFVLRRTKDEVLEELPRKIEILRKVPFGKAQSLLYENIRIAMEGKVREEIAKKGLAKSHITILDALLKLRQVCCDPALLSMSHAKSVKESAKREMFFELLEELLEEGRKILVFSQFTTMLAILEDELRKRGIEYSKLTGRTRDREAAIEKFGEDECRVFLISLKAGGVGLNLVEADTVIHYDPWWNPAVENQATDRAYRIGQTKTVFVYKLIVENSIEEKILELQETKSAIQKGIYDKAEGGEKIVDAQELMKLLSE